MNKVLITGRLTKEIELKKTSTNKSFVQFSLAVDNGYGDNKKTIFPNFTAWEKTAEFIERYFHKGDQLIVEGFLNESEYEKDGHKIKNTFVSVTNAEFGQTKKQDPIEPKKESYYPKEGLDVEPDDLPFY